MGITAAHRQLPQRRLQAPWLRAHRQQSARHVAHAVDRLIDQRGHLADGAGQLRAFQMNFFRDAGQHERNTGQFLAEPVVQVAADALALAQRDLQQIALPLLALGDLRVRQPRPARRKAEQHPALPGRGLEQLHEQGLAGGGRDAVES